MNKAQKMTKAQKIKYDNCLKDGISLMWCAFLINDEEEQNE